MARQRPTLPLGDRLLKMIDSVKLEETSAATFTTSLNVIYFGFIALEHMSALGLTASIQQGIVGQIIFRARRGLRNMRFNLEMESKKEEPPSLIGLTVSALF